jgi:hypothetical protein
MRRHACIGLGLLTVVLAGCGRNADTPSTAVPEAAAFVGEGACTGCHADQERAWQSSHHHAALQPATSDTVLGDFGDKELTRGTITTRFFRRDGEYWIATDGAEGSIRDFRVAYTFGVDPLQQYLVELDGVGHEAG